MQLIMKTAPQPLLKIYVLPQLFGYPTVEYVCLLSLNLEIVEVRVMMV